MIQDCGFSDLALAYPPYHWLIGNGPPRRASTRADDDRGGGYELDRAIAMWTVWLLGWGQGAVHPMLIELATKALWVNYCDGASAGNTGSQSAAGTTRKRHFNILLCSNAGESPVPKQHSTFLKSSQVPVGAHPA